MNENMKFMYDLYSFLLDSHYFKNFKFAQKSDAEFEERLKEFCNEKDMSNEDFEALEDMVACNLSASELKGFVNGVYAALRFFKEF